MDRTHPSFPDISDGIRELDLEESRFVNARVLMKVVVICKVGKLTLNCEDQGVSSNPTS